MIQNIQELKISQKVDANIKRIPTFSSRVSNAKIKVICGPMFSGKTKTLIAAIEEEKAKGKTVFVFKPKVDDRFAEEAVVSHDKDRSEDQVQAFRVGRPKEILDSYLNADVIAIDEVQFFDKSIVHVCDKIANNGKSVIVAGLDQDYLAQPFGSMPTLLTMADEVIKLNSVCTFCSGRARFSHRISKDAGIVVLGEKDKYVPLCRSCYTELSDKKH